MIYCPCCSQDITVIDGVVQFHYIIVPLPNYNECMVSNRTVEEAHALVPIFRALVDWTAKDQETFDSRVSRVRS